MSILEKLKKWFAYEDDNEESLSDEVLSEETESNEFEDEMEAEVNVDEVKSPKLVVDTSALGRIGSFEYIMEYPKIVLLMDVVEELERYRKSEDILGVNIRKILTECAKDVESKKFTVINAERTSNYTDNVLIDYCRGKDVILYTADYPLATKAKGYGIRYILSEDDQEKKQKSTIKYTTMMGNKLFLKNATTYKIRYIVFDEGGIKKESFKDTIRLKVGDNLIIMTYTIKNDGLMVSHYVITDERLEYNAKYIRSYCIGQNENLIGNLNFSHDIKREIKNYFMTVRKYK